MHTTLAATQRAPKYHPSTTQVDTLIQNMSDTFLNMKEMAQICGLRNLHHFRDNYVIPAISEGAIERQFPDQPKHPRQKYRLTEKAVEYKKSLNKSY